jgi:hypothetical protein
MPDRTRERSLLEQRRSQERVARERVDYELLDEPALDGRMLSADALARVQELVGRTLTRLGTRKDSAELADGRIVCRIERTPGRHTRVQVPTGTLNMLDLTVSLRARADRESAGSPEPAEGLERAV